MAGQPEHFQHAGVSTYPDHPFHCVTVLIIRKCPFSGAKIHLLTLSTGQKCIFSSIWQDQGYLETAVMSAPRFPCLRLLCCVNHPWYGHHVAHRLPSCRIICKGKEGKLNYWSQFRCVERKAPSLPGRVSEPSLVFPAL